MTDFHVPQRPPAHAHVTTGFQAASPLCIVVGHAWEKRWQLSGLFLWRDCTRYGCDVAQSWQVDDIESWAKLLADADDNDRSTKQPLFDKPRDGGPWKGPSMTDWLRKFPSLPPSATKGDPDVRPGFDEVESEGRARGRRLPPRASDRRRGLDEDHGRDADPVG